MALTVTLRSFFSMRAQTSARELVAWMCETFFSRSGFCSARAKRACRKKIALGARVLCCARSSSNFCARARFVRHSASIATASGKNSSDGAICSIARFSRALELNSHTSGMMGTPRRFISSSSRSRSGRPLSGQRSIRYATAAGRRNMGLCPVCRPEMFSAAPNPAGRKPAERTGRKSMLR